MTAAAPYPFRVLLTDTRVNCEITVRYTIYFRRYLMVDLLRSGLARIDSALRES